MDLVNPTLQHAATEHLRFALEDLFTGKAPDEPWEALCARLARQSQEGLVDLGAAFSEAAKGLVGIFGFGNWANNRVLEILADPVRIVSGTVVLHGPERPSILNQVSSVDSDPLSSLFTEEQIDNAKPSAETVARSAYTFNFTKEEVAELEEAAEYYGENID